MMKVLILLLGLMMFVTACGGVTVSQCEALDITRDHLPASFADTSAIVAIYTDETNDEKWKVLFPVVYITFEDLDWEGDASQYFKPPGENAPELNLPEGVYLNVVLYINAKTGKVTGRELNNDTILGYPDMYAKCD